MSGPMDVPVEELLPGDVIEDGSRVEERPTVDTIGRVRVVWATGYVAFYYRRTRFRLHRISEAR